VAQTKIVEKAGCHLVGMIRLLSWVEVHKPWGAGKIRRL
jgi:hypothetical protein